MLPTIPRFQVVRGMVWGGAIAHTNLVLVGLALSRLLWAVDGAPEFPPAGVVRGDRMVEILVPGVGMSIYRRYLGPATGCVGRADQKQVETPNPRAVIPAFADVSAYPKELCNVQVLIGAEPAALAGAGSSIHQANRKVRSAHTVVRQRRSDTDVPGRLQERCRLGTQARPAARRTEDRQDPVELFLANH
jgi:hypothetical protein